MKDLTYLYVEDDPLSREALYLILKRVMKIENLHIFEDSENFMTRLRALPKVPNVILLDIHVYPYTGFEMMEMLRSDNTYNDSRIIALTASVMNEEVELLKNTGFDGVIGKPINVANFPSILERVVSGETIWHISDM